MIAFNKKTALRKKVLYFKMLFEIKIYGLKTCLMLIRFVCVQDVKALRLYKNIVSKKKLFNFSQDLWLAAIWLDPSIAIMSQQQVLLNKYMII